MRSWRRVVGIIFVGSLILRVVYALWLWPDTLPGDAGDYWAEAGQIASGEGPGDYWPPGLVYWLALWRILLGDASWVAVCATLTVWGIFWVIFVGLTRHGPPRLRLALLLLFAVYPAFVHQSVVPLTHLPVATLMLAMFAVLRRTQRQDNGGLIGSLLGIAALLRPGVLALIPILGLWVWRKATHPRLSIIGLLIGLLLPVGLWLGRAHAQHGYWVRINRANSYNFFIGNQPETPTYRTWWLGSHDERSNSTFAPYYHRLDSIRALPVSQQERAFQTLAWQHIGDDLLHFGQRVLARWRCFWAFDTLAGATITRRNPMLGYLILILDSFCFMILVSAVLAALSSLQKVRAEYRCLLAWIAAYQIPYLLAFSHPTYHLPVLPLLGLIIASQSARLWPQGKTRAYWIVSIGIVAAIQVEWVLQMWP